MFFDQSFSTELLRLPQAVLDQRPVYQRFYTDSLIQPVIDLHREMPLSMFKKEPIDG